MWPAQPRPSPVPTPNPPNGIKLAPAGRREEGGGGRGGGGGPAEQRQLALSDAPPGGSTQACVRGGTGESPRPLCPGSLAVAWGSGPGWGVCKYACIPRVCRGRCAPVICAKGLRGGTCAHLRCVVRGRGGGPQGLCSPCGRRRVSAGLVRTGPRHPVCGGPRVCRGLCTRPCGPKISPLWGCRASSVHPCRWAGQTFWGVWAAVWPRGCACAL